jgi:hypothetical protein
MSNLKQRTLDFLEIEWATYIERFNRWSAEDGLKRVNEQGYEQFRDMLAHVLAWWVEGMGIILAIAEEREYARKKYDFDAFNAEAVAKYKNWDEAEFLAHFENTRQNAATSLKSMNEAAWENKRVQSWVNGIFIHHAREHLVALSRFLLLDTLENEWSEYVEKFDRLENKVEFLKAQGFERFEDILAHVIGWWSECVVVIEGAMNDTTFVYREIDTDSFNKELVEKYKVMSGAELREAFEINRIAFTAILRELPDSAFENPTIESWLAADVVGHYDGHKV